MKQKKILVTAEILGGVSARVNLGVLWRSRGASAGGDLLGAGESDRAAERLRRGEEFTMLECAREVLAVTASKSEISFMPQPVDDPARRRPVFADEDVVSGGVDAEVDGSGGGCRGVS
jgi:hypothetical protein